MSKLWYDKPATHWEAALPIGNGRLGAMVFGGTREERLQLNEDTLWSGEPKDCNNPDAATWIPKVREALFAGDYLKADELSKNMQGPFNQSYQPLGDLSLTFELNDAIEDYHRELDLESGIALTRFRSMGSMYERRVFASVPDDVIVVALEADTSGHLSLTARLHSKLRHSVLAEDDTTLVLRGQAPFHVDPSYHGPDPGYVYDDEKGMRFSLFLRAIVQGGSIFQGEEGTLRISEADRVLLILSADTSFNGFDRSPSADGVDPDTEARTRLEAAAAKGLEKLNASHLADHQSLFRRVSMDLGPSHDSEPTDRRVQAYADGAADPGLAALVFQYGRYLLMASSRPGTQPANLQGIWNDHIRPPWSSNWTMNINSEMNYWPAESTHLSECHEPMLRFLSELAINGRETARVNYGLPGWVAHHNADLWRQSAPAGNYGQGAPTWACFNMSPAWHCMDLWERYAFGGDTAYLRDCAYPLMKEAAEFCLAWLVPDDQGYLVTAPSTSTENTFITPDGQPAQLSIASTQDMALIRDLFSHTIEAAQILDWDHGFCEELIAARARLLPWRIGKRGQLQEWSIDFDEAEPHHRHLSHLIGLYPSNQITPEETPDLAQAARRSLDLRGDDSTGWSMAWKVNLWARLKDGNRAHKMLDYLLRLVEQRGTQFTGGGVYANLFDAHPPFQIDGNFGVTSGIAEMLLQSHRRTPEGGYIIDLLPALPDAWPEGYVKGLRARGGLTVDLCWKDGVLEESAITAGRTTRTQVTYGNATCSLDFNEGQTVRLKGRNHPPELLEA